MEHKIGDCITKLRKEKGLTQLELAEQLQLSDKAVSKWESNKGEPSLEFLPRLAEIFNVTLDYLMTGKTDEEKISIEDMDKTKRAIYFVNKDDVKNFEKYGYLNDTILFEYDVGIRHDMELSERFMLNSKIRDLIYDNESTKIFSKVADTFFNSKTIKNLMKEYSHESYVDLIYNDINSFVKMSALAGRVDLLEKINLKSFSIGTSAKTYGIRNAINKPYLISSDTISFIFTNKRVPENVLKFLANVKFDKDKTDYLLIDEIMFQLYKSKKFDLLKTAFENYKKHLKEVEGILAKIDEDNKNLQYKADYINVKYENYKLFRKKDILFVNENNDYIIAIVCPIEKALTEALNNKDIEYIEKFNSYNKLLVQKANVNCNIVSEKEIKLMKMKQDKNESVFNIIELECTEDYLIDMELAYKSIAKDENETEPEYLKKLLNNVDDIYNKVVKKSYISYKEFIEDKLDKKDYKTLFKFAVDYNLTELQNNIMTKDYDGAKKYSNRVFSVENSIIKTYNNLIENNKQIEKNLLTASIWNEGSLKMEKGENLRRISNIKSDISKNYNGDFKRILDRQIKVCKMDLLGHVDNIIDESKKYKEEFYNHTKQMLIDKIESLTHEQKAKQEYERIENEISWDYLYKEANDNFETAIIKLCVRLESILKYKYKYEGDLFTVLDMYMKEYLQWKNAWDDDYDDANAIADSNKDLLQRLRIKRNNIVHAENTPVEFNEKDLKSCIDFVKKM